MQSSSNIVRKTFSLTTAMKIYPQKLFPNQTDPTNFSRETWRRADYYNFLPHPTISIISSSSSSSLRSLARENSDRIVDSEGRRRRSNGIKKHGGWRASDLHERGEIRATTGKPGLNCIKSSPVHCRKPNGNRCPITSVVSCCKRVTVLPLVRPLYATQRWQ